jgi:predicted DNA-binding transcriptional regulator AlpA
VSLSPTLTKANQKHRAKAALAAERPAQRVDHNHIHAPRGPPGGIRLLDKAEILAITGVTYPTIWAWMRAGKFPRARIAGGKSMWLSSEIDAWLAGLQVRPLKGDAPSTQQPEDK